jgi:CRISPR system Cascade subunit CasA
LSLYTWQSRRIRLFGDRAGISGAMVSNGDPIDWQDGHRREPMSVWGRSGPREQKQKRLPIYLPRPHDHTRQLWRGLQTLLPPPAQAGEPAQRLSPLVSQWLAHLTVGGVIGPDVLVRQCATSVAYGSNQSVIDEVYSDALTMNVLVLVDGSPLRTIAVDGSADAEAAVRQLRNFAANLVRAAGGRDAGNGAAERAAELGYAQLDSDFRQWLLGLRPDRDPVAARTVWQRTVRGAVSRLGARLAAAAGPAAWTGRMVEDRSGQEVHLCTSQAEAWFRRGLAKALPMATDRPDRRQEDGHDDRDEQ